ncbi:MAG: DUF177 domain-containing protein [Desulfobulbus sp.]|nr:DUF177 domain-containing protein [Desulfobulbus sp.]
MLVRFNEISPYGSEFELHDIGDIAEQQDFVVNGAIRAGCALERKGEYKVVMRGRVEVELLVPCDRCLRLFPFQVNAVFQQLFTVESEDAWRIKEVDSSPVDLETEILDEPVIDLDDVLRQQVYLAIPVKKLCLEACEGLCLQCGVNLNETACECGKENKESPFSVLAQLKK